MNIRANPPLWRHDAYTLRCLYLAITNCIDLAKSLGHLKAFSSVVDVGCGEAPYREVFSSSGSNYIGCDIQPGPQVDVLIDSEGRIPLQDGIADCVVSFQVLEHVWDLDLYLKECRRLLAKDGLLILSTHGNWLYHPHPTDYRRWTRDGLLKEISTRGFDIVQTWSVVGPLAWTTQFRTLAYHHLFSRQGKIGAIISFVICLLMYWRMALEDRITPIVVREDNAAVYLMVARRAS